MPDESKPEFKAAQSRHGEFIKFTRQVSRMTGLTPNQVRSQLRNVEIGVNAPVAPAAPPPVFQTLPEFKPGPTQDQGFEPRPFALQVPLPATRPADAPSEQKQVIIVDNGTPNYYNIPADFVGAV